MNKIKMDASVLKFFFALIVFILLLSAMPIKYFLETYDTYTETSREFFTITGFSTNRRAYDIEFVCEGEERMTAVGYEIYKNVDIGDTVVCDVERFYKNKTGEHTRSVFHFVELRHN